MTTQLQKLFFSIDLLDRVTGPIGRMQKRIDRFTTRVSGGFARIGAGALGVAGAGMGLAQVVQPAIDMTRALGEVKSLDVGQDVLDRLTAASMRFTNQFGGASADFVRSAYDIQSAIGGLVGDELAAFTSASNILAKGTKADAATVTSYMGTMYGIFKSSADAMGKARWVELLTGQTATAVKMFKTTGMEMASSFESLGASATVAGIAAAEQMAVLGTLQATMSGSEAGTKYQAFINNVGRAQEKLGMAFTDENGAMLGVVDILEKLRGRFGDVLNVAESDALADAFGSDEAVDMIKLLMADTGGLTTAIDRLGKVTGMDQAVKMAKDMTDSWQRLGAVIHNVRTAFAMVLLPAISPVIGKFISGAATIQRWTTMFPNLTRVIGYATLIVFGLVAALGAFAVIAGIVNLILLANPVLWVAAGVAALIAGVAALIIWWDQFKATMMENAWFNVVFTMFGAIIEMYRRTGAILGGTIQQILYAIQWWGDLKDTLFNFDWMDWMGEKFDWLKGVLLNFDWMDTLVNAFNSIFEQLENIPGFSWMMEKIGASADTGGDRSADSPALNAPREANVPPGGISKQITNSINSSHSNTRQRVVGDVTINNQQPMTPAQMDEWLFMGAG